MRLTEAETRATRWRHGPATAAALCLLAACLPWAAWAQEGARVPLPRLLGETHIHGLALERSTPPRLLIATHHGLYASADGLTAQIVSTQRDDLMGFMPHPTEAGTLYASGHPAQGGNLGIIVSRDGGRTWRPLASGVSGPVDFHQMDISLADPRVLYGVYGTLQVSRDGGRTWSAVGQPLDKVIDLAASSVSADTVYLATASGLRVSRDGGRRWEPAHPSGKAATLVHTTPAGTVYAFVGGTGLMRAQESDLRWEVLSNGFGREAPLHLAVHPHRPERLYLATNRNTLVTSMDGGKTWAVLARPAR